MLMLHSDCRTSRHKRREQRAGAAMILMLLLLVVVIGMVAFAVDAGLMVVLRAEVQNAVDSGALAAGLKLQDNPDEVNEAVDYAKEYVQRNQAGMGAIVPADVIDVEPGHFDSTSKTFTAFAAEPNAVRVFARQDDQPFFFSRVLGQTVFGAPAEAVASSAPNLDIMMVLDLSGSMKNQGRIEALQNAAPTFVYIFQEFGGKDQIGVMGLAADPGDYDPEDEGHTGALYDSGLHPTDDHYVGVLEAPLTTNLEGLRTSTLHSSVLEANRYSGWTGTGAATGDAVHYLINGAEARSNVDKVIVLMSDGHANRPSGNGPGYARTMATYAADNDVTIYTVSLGNGADLVLMQDMADMTGGEHYDATGSGEAQLTAALTEAFKSAAAAIKRVQLVQ